MRTVGAAAAVLHFSMVSVGMLAHVLSHVPAAGATEQLQPQSEGTNSIAGHQHCTVCQVLAGSSAARVESVKATEPDASEWVAPPLQFRVRVQQHHYSPVGARAPPVS